MSFIGSHIAIEKTLKDTLKKANEQEMSAIQLFLGSPYQLKRRSILDKDIDIVNTKYSSIQIFSHLPYVHNLAGSIKHKTVAWEDHEETNQYVNECITSIETELNILSKCKCQHKGCVLHMGSCKDKKKGLEAVAKSINQINFIGDAPLLLETMVGNGTVLGKTFEELATVYSLIDQDKQSNIGFCIDTCHIFASGQYNISNTKEIDKMFEDFERFFPSSKCKLIHLNDSKEGFSSQKDRHQLLCKGSIWSEPNHDSLLYLIKVCRSKDIPMILETSEDDFLNLKQLSLKI